MINIFWIFLIGISLSMDAFSLSIYLGGILRRKRTFILLVGIFHLIMPILGSLVGYKVANIFHLNGELIFSLILIMLGLQIIFIKKDEEEIKRYSLYKLIILAFGVAIDSFTIGFALSFNTNIIIICAIIFSIISMIFTALGLIIGKYANKVMGKHSQIFGGMIILLLGLIHLIG